MTYYAILLEQAPFLDTIHYFLAKSMNFLKNYFEKKQKKMNSTSKLFFPIQNPRKGRKKINVSPAIFCFTKKTSKKTSKKYAATKTHELLFKTY